MRRLVVLGAVLALSLPALAVDERTRICDLSADSLKPGESEWGLIWGRYTRGVLPGLQVGTHIGLDALSLLNGFARYQFLDRPELRASIDVGLVWVALPFLFAEEGARPPVILFFPVELRASVPFSGNTELHAAWAFRGAWSSLVGSALGTSNVRVDLTLAHHDSAGAWLLMGRFPLFSRTTASMDALVGGTSEAAAVVLDDLAAWSITVGREFVFGETGHVRFGAGYRATPGILFVESLGHLTLLFDVYWR